MKGLSAVLFLFSVLCMNAQREIKRVLELQISPLFETQALVSGKKYITINNDTLSIEKFKFYLSAIALQFEDGTKWLEENSYHLVDIENPNSLIIPLRNISAKKISAIDFNIGVDSLASVSGALAGELDPAKGMYWAWNSGYINAKLEGFCFAENKKHSFEFHIGGYLSPNYTLRFVSLPINDEVGGKINLNCDAASWLKDLDLKKENRIVIPGTNAMQMADKYCKMFSVAPRL